MPPRDIDGHGTHCAGTAAGNYGVETSITPSGALLSGVAPRARLVAYKVNLRGCQPGYAAEQNTTRD